MYIKDKNCEPLTSVLSDIVVELVDYYIDLGYAYSCLFCANAVADDLYVLRYTLPGS